MELVTDAKRQVQDEYGIPENKQIWLMGETELFDHVPLEQYGFEEDDDRELVLVINSEPCYIEAEVDCSRGPLDLPDQLINYITKDEWTRFQKEQHIQLWDQVQRLLEKCVILACLAGTCYLWLHKSESSGKKSKDNASIIFVSILGLWAWSIMAQLQKVILLLHNGSGKKSTAAEALLSCLSEVGCFQGRVRFEPNDVEALLSCPSEVGFFQGRVRFLPTEAARLAGLQGRRDYSSWVTMRYYLDARERI